MKEGEVGLIYLQPPVLWVEFFLIVTVLGTKFAQLKFQILSTKNKQLQTRKPGRTEHTCSLLLQLSPRIFSRDAAMSSMSSW